MHIFIYSNFSAYLKNATTQKLKHIKITHYLLIQFTSLIMSLPMGLLQQCYVRIITHT
jgi:hypothetical protein